MLAEGRGAQTGFSVAGWLATMADNTEHVVVQPQRNTAVHDSIADTSLHVASVTSRKLLLFHCQRIGLAWA